VTHPMVDALLVAVPIEILNQRGWTDTARVEFARSHADALQSGADTAQFGGGTRRGEGAAYFAAFARVLAAMAYQPGGVTVFGQHWCTDHAACLAAEAEVAANPELPEQPAADGGRQVDAVAVAGGVL
jgi:hypothetical protein